MTKILIGTFNQGTVSEYEVTFKTHWAGIMGPGPKIIRCDDQAKDTGYGVWSTQDFGCSYQAPSSWKGRFPGNADSAIPFEDIIWIRDDKTWSYIDEKDYS